jgi:peroxiredoxin Q/BCP
MLNIGETIPDFSLLNQRGETVTSASLVGKPLVLFFYPKAETAGCTLEARGFRDDYAEFARLGANVLGISADPPSVQARFCGSQDLPYDLLCDTDLAVHRAFGLKKRLGLVMPRITFVFDERGVVRDVFDSMLKPLAHTATALKVVKRTVGAK